MSIDCIKHELSSVKKQIYPAFDDILKSIILNCTSAGSIYPNVLRLND